MAEEGPSGSRSRRRPMIGDHMAATEEDGDGGDDDEEEVGSTAGAYAWIREPRES